MFYGVNESSSGEGLKMASKDRKHGLEMSDGSSEFLLYQSEDGQARIQVRLLDKTVWLTQKQMAILYQTSVPNVHMHIEGIYEDAELAPEATIKKLLIVQNEGIRQVKRTIDHFNLDVILAVGYRVRSQRGTQFRQWVTRNLKEYLVKGFVLDDERLKRGEGEDYFDELLERIRAIRASVCLSNV